MVLVDVWYGYFVLWCRVVIYKVLINVLFFYKCFIFVFVFFFCFCNFVDVFKMFDIFKWIMIDEVYFFEYCIVE